MRAVLTGKGGVGKTTLCAVLSHIFAGQGYRVLAVDGDPQQNLAMTLGLSAQDAAEILPVAGSAEYLRQKTGAGPDITPGGLLTLNPDVSDVIDRFSLRVSPRIRLLVMGGVQRAGTGCLCPEYTLLAAILRHLPDLPDEVVLLDTPAGMEHFGRGVAGDFTSAVVVSDTSYNALAVAKECFGLARQLGIGNVILGINQTNEHPRPDRMQAVPLDGARFSRTITLPFEPGFLDAEPSVLPVLSKNSAFVSAVRQLADHLAASGNSPDLHHG